MADSWVPAIKDWANGVSLQETDLDQEIRDRFQAIYNALTADASADSDIWHGHKSGTLANRPAAAHAGRVYYATDLGLQFIDNGTRWDVIGVNPRICEHIFDEFVLSRAATAFTTNPAGELLPWTLNQTGGQFQMSGAGDRTRLNITVLGTASGNSATMAPVSSGAHFQMDLATDRVPAIIYDRLQTVFTTNQTVLFGVAAGGTATPDGIYFKRIDTGTVGNWRGICRAAGVQTETTLAAAGDTSYHDFEIVIESLTSVKFYIDGTQITPTIASNIPTTTDLALQFYLANSAVEQKQVNRDRVDMWSRRQ